MRRCHIQERFYCGHRVGFQVSQLRQRRRVHPILGGIEEVIRALSHASGEGAGDADPPVAAFVGECPDGPGHLVRAVHHAHRDDRRHDQAEVAAANIVSEIEGKEPSAEYYHEIAAIIDAGGADSIAFSRSIVSRSVTRSPSSSK